MYFVDEWREGPDLDWLGKDKERTKARCAICKKTKYSCLLQGSQL